MNDSGLTIGALATASGLSQRALRLYEQRGLIGPVTRDFGGRRRYSLADVARVEQIVTLRQWGLPLESVPAALADPAAVDQFLDARIRALDGGIEQLQAYRADLARVRAAREQGHTALRGFVSADEVFDRVRQLVAGEVEPDVFAAAVDASSGSSAFPDLYTRAERLLRDGFAPQSPDMQEVAGLMERLSAQLTGGRLERSEAVRTAWKEHSAELTGRDYSDLSSYVDAARETYRRSVSAS